jgi:hypothetical protein
MAQAGIGAAQRLGHGLIVAFAEKTAKLVPLPSQVAPRGCGKPSLTAIFQIPQGWNDCAAAGSAPTKQS